LPTGVSIAINPKNTKNIVAAVGMKVLITLDGGKSWTESTPKSPLGLGGEPVIISDGKGEFHYFHLAQQNGKGPGNEGWLSYIVCHTSIDGGVTWGEGVSVGSNPPKNQLNTRATPHFITSGMYLTWTQFDHYGSSDSSCQSNILFSKSAHGKRWTDPVQINHAPGNCCGGSGSPGGAIAGVNANGRLFVLWSLLDGIFFDRSYDDGDTWLANDLLVVNQAGGSWINVPGIGSCNNMPTLVVDNSETFFRGSLYVTYADTSSGRNDADIWLTRSTNRGDSWTKPQRVNKDGAGKHQFMPMMTLDEVTGVTYMVYYDRRAYNDLQTDVYLAYSLDGTNHFSETKISDSPFVPSIDRTFVKYIGISAHKGVIVPIWTRMEGGHLSVWTTLLRQEELFKKEDLPKRQTSIRGLRP